LALAGNAVADDMVDRGADRLGEAAVVERRRDRLTVEDEVMAQLVELGRGHALAHLGRDEVQRLGGEPAGLAHGLELGWAVELDARGLAGPLGWGFLSRIHPSN